MKRCPSCQRTFTDDLSFCVEDAARLEDTGVHTLADLTRDGARVSPRRAIDLALSLCAALDPSRTRQRIPNALTPIEVEVDGDAARVTLSLESAKPIREAHSLDPAASYTAPECLSDTDAVTAAATVYNIAALLHHALTGDVPFAAATNAAVAVRKLLEDAPSSRAFVPSLPESLDALLTRSLDRTPTSRPATPADFATALRAIELPVAEPLPLASPAPRAAAAPFAAPGAAPSFAGAAPMPQAAPIARASEAAAPTMAAPSRGRSGVAFLVVGGVALVALALSATMLTGRRSSDAPMTSSRAEPPAPPVNAASSNSAAATAPTPAVEPTIAPTMPVSPALTTIEPPIQRPRPARLRTLPRPRPPAMAARRGAGERAPMADIDVGLDTGIDAPTNPTPHVATRHRAPTPPRPITPTTHDPRPVQGEGVRPTTEVPAPVVGQGAQAAAIARSTAPPQQGLTTPTPEAEPSRVGPVPTQSARDEGTDPLVFVGLAVALLGLASVATGVFLLRRRAKAEAQPPPWQPPLATPWQPLPAPPPPVPQTIPATQIAVVAPAQHAPWKGSVEQHDTVADAAWASTVQVAQGAPPTSAIWCSRCGTQSPAEARFCPTDGADLSQVGTTLDPRTRPPVPPTAPEMKPFTVGAYRCEARLGEGGMGVVYRARHIEQGYAVAVKVLLLGGRAEGSLIERFRREARLAASIKHPNSVAIYDYGELDGRLFYLAMEFIDGRSLDAVMGDQPLPFTRSLSIVRQVCAALAEAHAAGIVHRDLKPANVMVCERPDGTDAVKLVDFGIARDLRATGERTMAGIVVGTPAYMAPEQARGEPGVDARADVFALGVMTYEMLSGQHPYEARGNAIQQIVTRATLRESAPPLSAVTTAKCAPLDDVLARAIAPDPAVRTPSIAAFSEALTSAASLGAAA
jgi:serine/threonine protein kinase